VPGDLTPWYVPMIPDADIVALSGSVSNHWRQEVGRAHRHQLDEDGLLLLGQALERAGEAASGANWRGSKPVGSGGTIDRIGLMKRAISTISWPYSSYASASSFDQRRNSRIVRPWSLTRHR
jgi:hypothetical protein